MGYIHFYSTHNIKVNCKTKCACRCFQTVSSRSCLSGMQIYCVLPGFFLLHQCCAVRLCKLITVYSTLCVYAFKMKYYRAIQEAWLMLIILIHFKTTALWISIVIASVGTWPTFTKVGLFCKSNCRKQRKMHYLIQFNFKYGPFKLTDGYINMILPKI